MQNFGNMQTSHNAGVVERKPILPRGMPHPSNNHYTNASDGGGHGVQGANANSVLSHLNL